MATVPTLHMDEFREFARPLIESGRYKDADAVLVAAMDALLREECNDEAKIAYLRQAIADGEASGLYEGDAFADVLTELGLSQRLE